MLFIGVLGYLGPSLFGLAGAKMIETGHIVQVLWIVLFLLALLLLAVTTRFSVFAVATAAVLVFWSSTTRRGFQIVAAYAITWFLLLSGVRGLLEDGLAAGDAGNLQGRTFIPRFIWFLFWLTGTITAIAIGGKWLILRN